jgi:heat-inducible transcriptional repressor
VAAAGVHMFMTNISTLNDRARDVFKLLVDQYIANGEPIGSRTLSKLNSLNLSPASIRNVMQDLEELGLLAAPHTSAGRIPTEAGLRLFVDGMMQVSGLTLAEQARIERDLKPDGKRLEDVLGEATHMLAGLSACAGLVLVPKQDAPIRQIDFLPLSPDRVLAILVGQDGSVENRVVQLPVGVPPAALMQAGNYINTRLVGLTLEQARVRLEAEVLANRAELDQLSMSVVNQGLGVWAHEGGDRDILIVRGQAHLLEDKAAEQDLERVRRLLDDIETKKELVRVLDMARDAAAMRIFIGAETKLFSLSGSSVIAAPYKDVEERVVGVIGIIGPTRLNYARIVPMVDYTAKALGRLIR